MAEATDRGVFGRVVWRDGQGVHVATMATDGHWSVVSRPPRAFDALLARDLDDRFLDSYLATGPADGFPGHRELSAAAKYLNGRAIPTDPNPGTDSAEVVY